MELYLFNIFKSELKICKEIKIKTTYCITKKNSDFMIQPFKKLKTDLKKFYHPNPDISDHVFHGRPNHPTLNSYEWIKLVDEITEKYAKNNINVFTDEFVFAHPFTGKTVDHIKFKEVLTQIKKTYDKKPKK